MAGPKFEDKDSFIIDVNSYLNKAPIEGEPAAQPEQSDKIKIDNAFNLLKEICETARMDEAELMNRLDKDVEKKKLEREIQDAKDNVSLQDEKKNALKVLL